MSINSELKRLYRAMNEDYAAACANSREAALRALKPGEQAPAMTGIHGEAERANFASRAIEYGRQAQALVDAAMKEARTAAAAPPSAEALNSVQMLSLNPSASAKDFQLIMERYGDNLQTAKTLHGMAMSRKLSVNFRNAAADRLEAMENLSLNIPQTFSVETLEKHGGSSAIFDYLVEGAIDAAFEP